MLLFTLALAAPTTVHATIGGRERSALVVRPKKAEHPGIVVAFHGLGGSGGGIASRWEAMAERDGLIVVVPQVPTVEGWFAGKPVDHTSYDRALFTGWRDWAVAQGGDPERVYLMGYSMGAHLAASLYCSGTEVAGLGLIGMSMTTTQERDCKAKPAPVVYVANTQDRLSTAGNRRAGGLTFELVSQESTLARLYDVNGCQGEPTKKGPDTRASCGTTPVVAHRMDTASHALNANGFDPVAFVWKTLAD